MNNKRYSVYFIEQAEIDLYQIYSYVAYSDTVVSAENLFKKLTERCMALDYMPERGSFLKELARLGIFEFRELNVKPYRIIYQILDDNVFVHAILDGRRDLKDHLMWRLITAVES